MRAEPLDRVDEQRDPRGLAELGQRVQVVAEPGGELDVADRKHPGRAIDGGRQVVEPDPPVAARHLPQRDAPARQVHPGIEIGGVFVGGRDDVVAGPPGISLGDQADAVGRAAE